MTLLVVTLLLLLLLGVPVGIALGGASVFYALVIADYNLVSVGQSFFFYLDNYTLMAIPFFILAGFLMDRFGLVKQLFDFAEAALDWLPGGVGIAAVVTCVLFAAMSGSAAAMASAMSLIVIPSMMSRGYPRQMAAGLVAVGGGVGLLMPPSLSLILFGVATETSIPRLFLAGVLPAILLGGGMITVVVVSAYVLKVETNPLDLRNVLRTFIRALPALGMPALVLGGLYGGVFTATEAAAVAVGYTLFIGLFYKRSTFFSEAYYAARNALNISTMIFFLLGSVGMFQFIASNEFWPQEFATRIIDMNLSPTAFLFIFAALLLLLGMFLDGTSMILLTVPIVFPVALALDISPMHLAVIVTMGVELGAITPPVGFNLYAVSGVAKIPVMEVIRGSTPFFIGDMTVFLILILVPFFSVWLPGLI